MADTKTPKTKAAPKPKTPKPIGGIGLEPPTKSQLSPAAQTVVEKIEARNKELSAPPVSPIFKDTALDTAAVAKVEKKPRAKREAKPKKDHGVVLQEVMGKIEGLIAKVLDAATRAFDDEQKITVRQAEKLAYEEGERAGIERGRKLALSSAIEALKKGA